VSQIVVPLVAATCCRREGHMITHFARQAVFRAIWCLLATFAYASPSSCAEQLRILVVMPSGSAKLTRQVTQFEDALRHSRGPVVQARSLAEADAVVQFTAYRRRVDDKGVPQDWWYGHHLFLKGSSQERRSTGGAKRFTLVIIDREDWQVEPVLELLGTTLRRALRQAQYSQEDSL
jgi:hypothetical protein